MLMLNEGRNGALMLMCVFVGHSFSHDMLLINCYMLILVLCLLKNEVIVWIRSARSIVTVSSSMLTST